MYVQRIFAGFVRCVQIVRDFCVCDPPIMMAGWINSEDMKAYYLADSKVSRNHFVLSQGWFVRSDAELQWRAPSWPEPRQNQVRLCLL